MSISEKLQTSALATITALTVPVILLNLLGGIVSGTWLAILGEWGEIIRGIIFFVASGFAVSFALMPSLLFAGPAAIAMERGKKILGALFGSLSILYTVALITVWCIWVMWLFVSSAAESSLIPLLFWSYGVALGPWMWLAQKDQQGGGNEFSILTTFFAQAAYILGMIMFFFNATLGTIAVIFGIIMLSGAIFQMIIVFGGEMKKSFASKDIKEALVILDEIGRTIGGSGFDLVREPVEKYLVSHGKEYKETVSETSARQWVYSAVANTAGDFMESGHYHIYRGVLNPMGPGGDLLKLFDSTIDELVKMGALEAENAKKEKARLRKNMDQMG